MLKLRILLATLFLSSAIAPTATLARGGSEGGGGGNDLIAEFVATANALFDQIDFIPEHRKLLKKALANSQIETGQRLLDPITGKTIPNQDRLIAWGAPGEIQLKERYFLHEASFEDAMKSQDPIAHIVIHELFRASGVVDAKGRSIDENFQLSIGLYKLDRNPTRGVRRAQRSVHALNAECKITDCKLRGGWYEDDDELICRPKNEALNGYLGSTVQVYKVGNPYEFERGDGTISIVRPKSLESRLGSQELMAVKIKDGIEGMEITDEAGDYLRNFMIRYSTKRTPVTSGSVTLSYSTPDKEYLIDLTLGECRTTLD